LHGSLTLQFLTGDFPTQNNDIPGRNCRENHAGRGKLKKKIAVKKESRAQSVDKQYPVETRALGLKVENFCKVCMG
jgi:hypothetical protein